MAVHRSHFVVDLMSAVRADRENAVSAWYVHSPVLALMQWYGFTAALTAARVVNRNSSHSRLALHCLVRRLGCNSLDQSVHVLVERL